MGLLLRMVDVVDRANWRWLLTDEQSGEPLADHTVAVDPPMAEPFGDLYRYLRRNAVPDRRVTSETELVAQVGEWIGREVLGQVGRAIMDAAPVTVRVLVPPEAEFMLFRPLELAHVDGVPLAVHGEVTLVYGIGGTASKAPVGDRLRMLAVFSLPTSTSALALRRERYELAHLIRRIAARQRRAVELRVLQYGVTRERLAEVAEDGWDLLHLSGHGGAGEFLLEKADGSPDPVTTPELVAMLRPTRRRVKLAVVSACQSAAATSAQMLRWLRLEEQAEELDAQANRETGDPAAIAPSLVRELDCAVVAMRYPVTDDFAIGLADGLYDRLLRRGQELDTALCRAVAEAAGREPSAARPAISVATPAVFGTRAIGLRLTPPQGSPILDPAQERMAGFPPEPARFVGRARAMAQASAALAPESGRTAVVLHGMAGAGKTACALELAYQHKDAFAALAFWQAPLNAEEFGGALADLALALERQLGGFAMVDKIGTVEQLERFLPRLRAMLEHAGLLLVLDNLETLLTPSGTWRDPRWIPLITALTDHRGESRVIMTSRVPPADVTALVLPVHALSRDEAIALARELPNLRALLHADDSPLRGEDAEDGRELVRRVLNIVQGHPKLLELADAAARDPDELTTHLSAAQAATPDEGTLNAFLRSGGSDLDADQFLDVLAQWTQSTLATLPEDAVLLLRVLCCLEDGDRWSGLVDANWADLWQRLNRPGDAADLTVMLDVLATAALIHIEPIDDTDSLYRLHPGIVETVLAITEPAVRTAVDAQLGDFWRSVAAAASQRKGTEVGQQIIHAALAAVPYLMRLQQWDTAAMLIEQAIRRDDSPRTRQATVANLRRIADATSTSRTRTLLSYALRDTEPHESERLLRDALRQDLSDENYEGASVVALDLVKLLRSHGRIGEAIDVAEKMASYTQRAGLGPWTQLADQGLLLQLLADRGEHERVLDEMTRLRGIMDQLPDHADDNEIVIPWNIRETTLDIGHTSALALGRWHECLSLNAEILEGVRHRGATALEIAATRFNDTGPLMNLGRLGEAEEIAIAFQRSAEENNDFRRLARAFGVRAGIEEARGGIETAISFLGTALRYAYIHPVLGDIARLHYNLAYHLWSSGSYSETQRAHTVAAAILFRLAGMAHNFRRCVRMLARSQRENDGSITLRQIIEHAERTEGVYLRRLIGTLASDQEAEEVLADILRIVREADDAETVDIEPWEPVIVVVVGAAGGDHGVAAQAAIVLETLAGRKEWTVLAGVLRQIIAGNRSRELLDGLDAVDAAIAGEILERLG